jgi:hypothetical protein
MVTVKGRGWVLLLYNVPPKPTAGRVAVWRKLKRLGAILLHDSAWVLPATPRTLEQLRWLAGEISELGGEAMIWEGAPCLDGHDERLVEQFTAQVDELYRGIDESLAASEPDLPALSRRYQQALQQDFFQSALGRQVRQLLLAAEGRLKG